MTNRLRSFSLAVIAVAAFSATAFAQEREPAGQNPRREMLEQRLRERTGEIVQRRLQLTEDQMRQLQTTNRQFEARRAELISREREIRRDLRTQMIAEKPDQAKVSQLLDQTMQLERQRLDLVQNEQRELAKFMTPVQRARLFAIQAELRRRAQEMRNGPMNRRNMPGRPPRRFN